MIEINLIPDIKQEFLRSQRLRGMVVSASIAACLVAGGIVVLLGVLLGAEAVRETVADNGIKDEYKALMTDNKDINDIVTIQTQLATISELNDKKLITSRVFDLLAAINPQAPNNIKMSQVVVDPVQKTVSVQGTADSGFNAVDAFKKTILNTNVAYTENNSDQSEPLSSDVIVGKTGLGQDSSGKQVLRFELSFQLPSELLSNTATNVRVVTPTGTIDVTDSHTRVPDSLFTQPATDVKGGS